MIQLILAAGSVIANGISASSAADVMDIQLNSKLDSLNNQAALVKIDKDSQLDQLSGRQKRDDLAVELTKEKNKAVQERVLADSKVELAQTKMAETKKLNKLAQKPELKALAKAYDEPQNNYNYGSPKSIA